jgi:hypothetical protein
MPANDIDPNETTATRRQRGERIAAELSGNPNPARRAVVTGGASGIGAETARALAAAGDVSGTSLG